MSWFLVALIGPLLYATCNHIDKVLLEKYFKEGGVGTLMLFSSLLSALVLPILFFVDPAIFEVSPVNIFILAFVGFLNVALLWLYFLALKDDEASVVIVFYQLVPVFGYVLGYIILDEVLTTLQLIAMAIIITGTTIISFEIDAENKFKLRKQTVAYMLSASFFWALSSVIFKSVALEENVWRSLFWEHVALALIGIVLFTFISSYRTHFIKVLRTNSAAVISLNFANESIYMLGTIIFSYAYLLAPVSLVLLANSFQALFVFLIGISCTLLLPKFTAEKIEAKHLWQKGMAVVITGLGTYLLFLE